MHIRQNLRKILICPGILLLFCSFVSAQTESTAHPFYPNWKLLQQHEKEQFLAGYLQAWLDARQTLEVVEQFVTDNPEQAVASLRKIKEIYDFSDVRPDTMARELDSYFARVENQKHPLSVAVTAARARLR